MKIAVVGSSKITEKLHSSVTSILYAFINEDDEIVSGGAKGVDSFAEEFADEHKLKKKIFKSKKDQWEGGYKERNLKIVDYCDMLLNIVINSTNTCFHHKSKGHDHSGGCWTALKAKGKGKFAQTIILRSQTNEAN